jgi:hypothetical protein
VFARRLGNRSDLRPLAGLDEPLPVAHQDAHAAMGRVGRFRLGSRFGTPLDELESGVLAMRRNVRPPSCAPDKNGKLTADRARRLRLASRS